MKKLITAAVAAAMLGGLMLAPTATAAPGECAESTSAAPVNDAQDATTIHAESPANDGEGCVVLEGGGDVPVNPLDNGHIGVYDGGDTPGLYGSCDGRNADGSFKAFDPAAPSDGAAEACQPGPA